MRVFVSTVLFAIVLFNIANAQQPLRSYIPIDYNGKPFKDSLYTQGSQSIPGRLELAYYDLGGQGVAYHDVTPENEGSKLNREVHDYGAHWRLGVPANIAFFRETEGVDISYTKDWADYSEYNKVHPKVNQLYIGWQENGEWTNYTVHVRAPGKYSIITVYGNNDNRSRLVVNQADTVSLHLPRSTGNWHYWDQAVIGEISFRNAGLYLLTLHYNSGANLAYLDFVLEEAY